MSDAELLRRAAATIEAGVTVFDPKLSRPLAEWLRHAASDIETLEMATSACSAAAVARVVLGQPGGTAHEDGGGPDLWPKSGY